MSSTKPRNTSSSTGSNDIIEPRNTASMEVSESINARNTPSTRSTRSIKAQNTASTRNTSSVYFPDILYSQVLGASVECCTYTQIHILLIIK